MKTFFIIIGSLIVLLSGSCSKKTIPVKETEKPTVTALPPKPVPAKIIKTPSPKVIAVNDAVAKKSIDGRLYYDLEGKRYWRNNKDGKYYLYRKGMLNDPAFKP